MFGIFPRMFVDQKLSRRWPEDYLRSTLQFLALDSAAKAAYLPPDFPAKTFHLGEADFQTGSPLIFICQLARDCCAAIAFSADDARGQLLDELRRLLELMAFSKDPFLWQSPLPRDQEDVVWELVARLAKMALELFGWPVASPGIPASVLLDEWSSGAYTDA